MTGEDNLDKQLVLSFNSSDKKSKEDREEKIKRERQELLNKIGSGNINNTRERVAFILNIYNEARNPDLELVWLFWKTFDNENFNGQYITKDQLYKLTRFNSLTRERARIQNDYKLFLANENVRKFRGVLEKDKRTEAIEEKPVGLPMFSIYIDEAGKTQQFLTVGSLWVVDGLSTMTAKRELSDWKEKEKINFEFHFKEINNYKLKYFKEFFLSFLKLNPTIGFKAIIIDKKGFSDINKAITDLTFHLIHKGIEHENETGRAPLPRHLQGWIDKDEKGSDQMKIENIKERIKSQNIEGLYLGDFFAVDSKDNIYIQAVDLFTSAINRKLHNPDTEGNVKNDFADYVLSLLNFDLSNFKKENANIDSSIIFNLTYNK